MGAVAGTNVRPCQRAVGVPDDRRRARRGPRPRRRCAGRRRGTPPAGARPSGRRAAGPAAARRRSGGRSGLRAARAGTVVERAAGTLRAVLPDGVHRLELPTPFAIGPVSCWLLRGDPLTLVDPGPLRDKTRAALDAGLRRARAARRGRRARRSSPTSTTTTSGLAAEVVAPLGRAPGHEPAARGVSRRLRARDGPRRRVLGRDDGPPRHRRRRARDARRHLALVPPLRRGRGGRRRRSATASSSSPAGARSRRSSARATARPTRSSSTPRRAARRRRPPAREGLLEPDRARADRRPRPGRGRDARSPPRARRVPRVDARDGGDGRLASCCRATASRSRDHRALVASARGHARAARAPDPALGRRRRARRRT